MSPLDQLIEEARATAARLTTILDKIDAREVKPLQLEVGKRYVRRDGKISGVVVACKHDEYTFKDTATNEKYLPNGRYWDECEEPEDLITEYTEPAAPEPSPTKPEPAKTLRDEIAMAALAAIISKAPFVVSPAGDKGALDSMTERVIGAYIYADIAMAVRDGKEPA